MTDTQIDDFLAHYGKKGMKWGQRKNLAVTTSSAGPIQSKKLSRREVRRLNKEGRAEFDRKKIEKIYNEAHQKGDDVIIATRLAGDHAVTLAGGKQIVDHLKAGGALDVTRLEVYARYDPATKSYVANNQQIGNYQKIKR